MKVPPSFLLIALFSLALIATISCKKSEGGGIDVSAQLQKLKATDVDSKVNACVELAKAGPGAAPAVADLTALLKDGDPLVRHLAAYALGQIGPKAASALPALKEALNDPDRQVVMDAVNALRFIGDTNANIQLNNTMSP